MRRLRIYSDRAALAPGARHVVLLYPWWGEVPEAPDEPARGRYEGYRRAGAALFEWSSLEECDAAVLPAPWEDVERDPRARELASAFLEQCARAGRPVVVFYWHDSDEPLALPGAMIFRTALRRSRRAPGEFAQPAWSEDLVERCLSGRLPLRRRGQPVVGFCGWADLSGPTAPQRARAWLRRQAGGLKLLPAVPPEGVTGWKLRGRALRVLERGRGLETRFVVRDGFFGGAFRPGAGYDGASARRVREEFVRNLAECDYALCVRGGGNFSYRFYEALCCGRIPVLVDTDCQLPYEGHLDWERCCLRVPETALSDLPGRIRDFHDSLSDGDFQDLQRHCRRVWEEWIRPEGFFANLHRHFDPASAASIDPAADA